MNFIFYLALVAFAIQGLLEFFCFYKPPDCGACVISGCTVMHVVCVYYYN